MKVEKQNQRNKGPTCALCKRSDDIPEKYGEKITLQEHDLTVHYFCLLMSSGIFQRGEEHEDIHGFLIEDIKKEILRSSKLTCINCKKKGASVGCSIKSCKRSVHMPCGAEKEFIYQFTDTFPSFCRKHAPTQSCGLNSTLPLSCTVCLESIEPVLSYSILKCPACHGSWFHRHCVQQLACSAAMFFFKCTLCNNKDQFQQEMLRMGIYIPERDASWELEDDAYGELLQVYQHCDAVKCHASKGRTYCPQSGPFEIVRCMFCGSKGSHKKCSDLSLYETDWSCCDCKAAVEGKQSLCLPDHRQDKRQGRKRCLKSISDYEPSLITKRQCMSASSSEILMDLAHQISLSQSTEVVVDSDEKVVEAALLVLRRGDFNPCCSLSVKFSHDKQNNGVRNRFRFLGHLIRGLQASEIFEGPDGQKNLALSSKALRDNLYFEVGSLMAISLVHGGPSLGFFSQALYHSLFNSTTNYRPTLQDLGDSVLSHKITKIAKSSSMKELTSAMQSASQYLRAAGCWRQISKLSEKDELVEDVLNFYQIVRLQLPLQRFREGLKTLGVFEKVQLCTESFYPVFCGGVDRLTAEFVMKLFSIEFSENAKQEAKEKKTLTLWEKYLHECEQGHCSASLEDLLTFVTATDSVPAFGFNPKPSISFFISAEPLFAFPQSQCETNHLILPIQTSYELFKQLFDYTIGQLTIMQAS